ncbi:MAG: class I SAM-dependent methyltransferase [Campylobacteraceae bacterium]|nr:class I SAM-dependent methyltransferase [Campylobacteraceae bacterium]
MQNKKDYYENKYVKQGLNISRYFKYQWAYLIRSFCDKKNPSILDLGGGSGEYAFEIQKINSNITLFDYSVNAIERAKAIGVKKIKCGDFLTYDFEDEKFDVVFVRGFSLLNTDDIDEFNRIIDLIKSILNKDGMILYWSQTNLKGEWTKSNWYNFSADELKLRFDMIDIYPSLRLQAFIPHSINKFISSILLRIKFFKRSFTCIGVVFDK